MAEYPKMVHGGNFEQIEFTNIEECLNIIRERLEQHIKSIPQPNELSINAIVIAPISWVVY